MTRSGYSDDCDGWSLIRWRGAVNSAIKGKRGQAFLREMAAALDAMPVKELIASELVAEDGACCAMGAVAKARGRDVSDVDPGERSDVALVMGIADALVAEIAHENDDDFSYSRTESPAARWTRMRLWVDEQIVKVTPSPAASSAVAEKHE